MDGEGELNTTKAMIGNYLYAKSNLSSPDIVNTFLCVLLRYLVNLTSEVS
jgi:hypothetical protein